MCFLVGFNKRLPALVSPPNNTITSGEENMIKFASDSPSICPVNSNILLAIVSPAVVTQQTFFFGMLG
jgi:hypothetical protein